MYRHEITEIAPHTWCLSEFRLVNAFLIEGEEKAALVDTGCGIGDLAGEVRALTDKPLIILLTHTHFDHDGGLLVLSGNAAIQKPRRQIPVIPNDLLIQSHCIMSHGQPFKRTFLIPELCHRVIADIHQPHIVFRLPLQND